MNFLIDTNAYKAINYIPQCYLPNWTGIICMPIR